MPTSVFDATKDRNHQELEKHERRKSQRQRSLVGAGLYKNSVRGIVLDVFDVAQVLMRDCADALAASDGKDPLSARKRTRIRSIERKLSWLNDSRAYGNTATSAPFDLRQTAHRDTSYPCYHLPGTIMISSTIGVPARGAYPAMTYTIQGIKGLRELR